MRRVSPKRCSLYHVSFYNMSKVAQGVQFYFSGRVLRDVWFRGESEVLFKGSSFVGVLVVRVEFGERRIGLVIPRVSFVEQKNTVYVVWCSSGAILSWSVRTVHLSDLFFWFGAAFFPFY